MLDEHKLFQVVDVLTTVTNTFDICFTNELASVINHQINQGLSENYALAGKPCSDHRAVTVDLEIQTTTTVDIPQKSKFFNFCRADYDKINQLTSTKSFSAVGWSISDVLVSEWYAWLEEIFEETITVRTIHRANLPPWVSPGTSYLLKRLKSKRKLNRNSSKVGISKKEVDDRVALEQAEYEQELSLGTRTNLLCKHFNSFGSQTRYPLQLHHWKKKPQMTLRKPICSMSISKAFTLFQVLLSTSSAQTKRASLKILIQAWSEYWALCISLMRPSQEAPTICLRLFQKHRYHSQELVTNNHKSEAN